MAGGGPVTRRERAVAVPYGRLAVVSALMLGSARNQGWRAARRGHGDDAAAWFVSIGRVWRARGASARKAECSVLCSVLGPLLGAQCQTGTFEPKWL